MSYDGLFQNTNWIIPFPYGSLGDDRSPILSPLIKAIFDRAVLQYITGPNHIEFYTRRFPAGQVRMELIGVGCLCSQFCSNDGLREGVLSECFFGHQKLNQSQAKLCSSCEFTAFPIVLAKQNLIFFFQVPIQAETIISYLFVCLFVCHLEGRKVKYSQPENYLAFPPWSI